MRPYDNRHQIHAGRSQLVELQDFFRREFDGHSRELRLEVCLFRMIPTAEKRQNGRSMDFQGFLCVFTDIPYAEEIQYVFKFVHAGKYAVGTKEKNGRRKEIYALIITFCIMRASR
jgi:hypothetical protein